MKKMSKVLSSMMVVGLAIQTAFSFPVLANDDISEEVLDVEVNDVEETPMEDFNEEVQDDLVEEEVLPETKDELPETEESEEVVLEEEVQEEVVNETPELLSEQPTLEQVQAKIDALPSLSEYTVSQRESVKAELKSIREQMKKLTSKDAQALNTTKVVNLETAVQMVIRTSYYSGDQVGDSWNPGNPVKVIEDSALIFQDLGDRVLAMPVFENETQFLAAVEGWGSRYNLYEVIANQGKRNETALGISFIKGKTWNVIQQPTFRVGVKTNHMHLMTVKENVDGTWGTATMDKTVSSLMNHAVNIVPTTPDGYTYYGYSMLDYHHVDGDFWTGTPGITEWISMDTVAAGLSKPDANGVMHWQSLLTAPGYTGYIYNYYSLLRTVEYNANGGTGTMDSGNYVSKKQVTVLENEFQREGYNFVGWNTEADGTGTSYAPNDVFAMPYVETLTLYAQWDQIPLPIVTPDSENPGPTTPQQPIVARTVEEETTETETPKEDVEKDEEPKEIEEVEVEKTPLANLGNWALVNLILMVLTVLAGLLLLLSKHEKEDTDDQDELENEDVVEMKSRRRWTKVVGTLLAVASVIVFFLTEDLSLNMAMTDQWTIWMAVMLLAEVIVLVLGKWWKKSEPQENE